MNVQIKVTIIAEGLLREPILEILKANGSTGFTIIACEGEGSRGNHTSDWEGRNVHIETIGDADTADKILNEIEARYLEDYSIIAYLTEVRVLRGSKFSKGHA